MNATVQTATRAGSGLMSMVMVGFLGAALVFAAGFANSSVIHDAAHDARHSTGFPCH